MEKEIILSQEEIQQICKRLGREITDKIKDEKKLPLVVGVMKGALNFMMDLIRYIDAPIYTDFIQISSYSGTSSRGQVQLVKDVAFDCENRTVILVEDIVDTGCSMKYLIEHIKGHNPAKVYVCTLFDKKTARKVDVKVDFIGKELEGDSFLIGYGLDYNELSRNLPYVYGARKSDVDELDKILEKDQNK